MSSLRSRSASIKTCVLITVGAVVAYGNGLVEAPDLITPLTQMVWLGDTVTMVSTGVLRAIGTMLRKATRTPSHRTRKTRLTYLKKENAALKMDNGSG